MKRIIIQVVLIAFAIFLAFKIFDSIQTPVTFTKEKSKKYEAVIESLKDIRKAQIAFKDVNGRFCGDFDSLIHFVKYDKIPKIRKIGMLNDSMIEAGLDEKAAMKKGLIIRDTIKVNVLTEIFSDGYAIDNLGTIPNSEGEKFWIGQAVIKTGSGVSVPVFEARAHNNQILKLLVADYKQEIININEQSRKNDKYPGLKVGSITEPNNNAGNFE